jgi:hypothetical protein
MINGVEENVRRHLGHHSLTADIDLVGVFIVFVTAQFEHFVQGPGLQSLVKFVGVECVGVLANGRLQHVTQLAGREQTRSAIRLACRIARPA